MHVDPAPRIAVLDSRPGVAVRLQSGPGGFLKLFQHLVDLPVAWLVLRRPGEQPGGVLVLELQRVGHVCNLMRVPSQNLHLLALLPLGIQISRQVVGRRLRRPRTAIQKLNHHGDLPARPTLPPPAR